MSDLVLRDLLVERLGKDYASILRQLSGLRYDDGRIEGFVYIKRHALFVNQLSLSVLKFLWGRQEPWREKLLWFVPRTGWLALQRILKRLGVHRSKENGHPEIILKSCNGIVVILLDERVVHKLVTPIAAEPGMVDNEVLAARAIGEHVPQILKHGRMAQDVAFLSTRLIDAERPVSFAKWPEYLNIITPILFSQYAYHGVRKATIEETITEIRKQLKNASSQRWFVDDMQRIEAKAFPLLDRYLGGSDKSRKIIFKLHCHGDLVPNNLLIEGDHKYLFDWANGGWHNAFYDLMVQELYWSDSVFWRRFDAISSVDEFDSTDILKGWGFKFITRFEELCGKQMEVQDIKIGVIISLIEKSLDSFFRYQFHKSEYENGKNILKLIFEILGNIHDTDVVDGQSI